MTAANIAGGASVSGDTDSGPLQALHVPRPVDRYDYVREKCRGLRVQDLGAYDETEVDKRQDDSWRWLHADKQRSARAIRAAASVEVLSAPHRFEICQL